MTKNITILVVNGPNLNFLGKRDKKHYGSLKLDEINQMVHNKVQEFSKQSVDLKFFQSNCEGDLIDFIQKHHQAQGLIINPGALAHYSYALADALADFSGLKVEVHLSNIKKREAFRAKSVTSRFCNKVFMGKKEQSYLEAIKWLSNKLKNL